MKKLTAILSIVLISIILVGCNDLSANQGPNIIVDSDIYIEVNDDSFQLEEHLLIVDDFDEEIPFQSSMIDDSDFDHTKLGSYKGLIEVTDSEGVMSTKEVTIHVQDTTPPVVTLNGSDVLTLRVGDEYTEAGAEIEDNYDMNLSLNIEGCVDTSLTGTYTLEYSCTDESGNTSTIVTREIHVIANSVIYQFSELVITQDEISFVIDINDPDNVSEITSVTLYQGDTVIESLSDFGDPSFTGLYSNNNYQIQVTYTYDLQDGNGLQEQTVSQDVTTLHKTDPTIDLISTATQETISFNISRTDPDNIMDIITVELYQGDTLTETLTDVTEGLFTGLLSNNTYSITVHYTYDLNDGAGAQEQTVIQEVVTLSKIIPSGDIINASATQDAISFDLDITDVDNVGHITTIELYQDDTLITTLSDNNTLMFSDLLSDSSFSIIVIYTYDLNDGLGAQVLNISLEQQTLAKTVPIVTITNIQTMQERMTFDIDVFDTDNVGNITAIELYRGDVLEQTATDLSTREFLGLLPNQVYTLEIRYTYDLNDGKGQTELMTRARREMTITNKIVNGDFSDIPNGELSYFVDGGANATAVITNEELVIDVINTGDEYWTVQYTFSNFELEANSTYILSFDATSTRERYIDINVGQRPTPTSWIGLDSTSINITNTINRYEFQFTTTSAITENVQIVFELGASLQPDGSYLPVDDTTFTFDNVNIYQEIDITEEMEQVYSWFELVRLDNGLHTSSVSSTVVSLYDNALAALVYTMMGDYEYAEDIFDFFNARIDSELKDQYGGFAQIRNLEGNIDGPIGNRWLGDNAWLLIAINYYHDRTNSNTYDLLATEIETWIVSLQNEDGGLNSGYDPTGFMQYPVTEAMIDSHNAVRGDTQFHTDLLNYLSTTRLDTQYGIYMAWPGHPTYQYSLDTIGWAYLGMNGLSDDILSVADALFLMEENGIYGYCADIDKDTIFTELTLTMAAAYNKSGNYIKANELVNYMDTLFMQVETDIKALPYTTSRATGYADFPLWETVDTEAHVSGTAWYIFTKMRLNPFEAGLTSDE